MSRFIDRGAVVAGWIGLGTAVVLVIAFALVVPIQPVVYVAALPVGLLIGWYANAKSERFRPRGRAMANALWAGLLTGPPIWLDGLVHIVDPGTPAPTVTGTSASSWTGT